MSEKIINVRKVIVEKKDLKKIMKQHGIPSLRKWAEMADANYPYFINCVNGRYIMGERYWKKLTDALKTPNPF
jgi:hypothetical protein